MHTTPTVTVERQVDGSPDVHTSPYEVEPSETPMTDAAMPSCTVSSPPRNRAKVADCAKALAAKAERSKTEETIVADIEYV